MTEETQHALTSTQLLIRPSSHCLLTSPKGKSHRDPPGLGQAKRLTDTEEQALRARMWVELAPATGKLSPQEMHCLSRNQRGLVAQKCRAGVSPTFFQLTNEEVMPQSCNTKMANRTALSKGTPRPGRLEKEGRKWKRPRPPGAGHVTPQMLWVPETRRC